MECAVDAQSLISMSLMKIHSSRTQRGGIKLHKNLLVSRVLRSARQLYVRERCAEIHRLQQQQHFEEVRAVCAEIRQLDPREIHEDQVEVEEEPACPRLRSPCALEEPLEACSHRGSGGGGCYAEVAPAHCSGSRTTVLDLDTHVVTTVESGLIQQDCGCGASPCAQRAPRKRKGEPSGAVCAPGAGEAEGEADWDSQPWQKRARRELEVSPCPAAAAVAEPANISTLISIFGSGFSGLLGRPAAELEQICGKQALASLGAWTRAIVAF